MEQFDAITDRRTRDAIRRVIDRLGHEPDKQGKSLVGGLAGYRSIRAAGQRYRVVYRVEASEVTVYVVAMGIRKEGSKIDVYTLALKLFRLGLLKLR